MCRICHFFLKFASCWDAENYVMHSKLPWSIFNISFLLFRKEEKGISSSTSIVCQPFIPAYGKHECQGSHQQGGVRTPRWEDACCCAGEAEDKEEDPLPCHWWSRRLHDFHLPLRSGDKWPFLPFSFLFPCVFILVCILAVLLQLSHISTHLP